MLTFLKVKSMEVLVSAIIKMLILTNSWSDLSKDTLLCVRRETTRLKSREDGETNRVSIMALSTLCTETLFI